MKYPRDWAFSLGCSVFSISDMALENTKEHKSNWIASNWFRLAVLLLAFSSISFYFYWYSIRPSQIKQACSWVTKTKPAIPYRAAMTIEEMEKKGMLKTCKKSPPQENRGFSSMFEEARVNVLYENCLADNKKAIAKYSKEQLAEPAKVFRNGQSKKNILFVYEIRDYRSCTTFSNHSGDLCRNRMRANCGKGFCWASCFL